MFALLAAFLVGTAVAKAIGSGMIVSLAAKADVALMFASMPLFFTSPRFVRREPPKPVAPGSCLV